MNPKQYFIIFGTILLSLSLILMFMPTSKTDLIVTTTISNKILKSPSIETTNAILIPHTIINFKTASIFDIFESGDLHVEIIANGKIQKKNIGTITITEIKEVTLKLSDVNPQLTKLTINLYENNILKDTKEVQI